MMKPYDVCRSEVIAKERARQLQTLGHRTSVRFNPVNEMYEIFVDEKEERGPKNMEDAFII